MSDFYKVIKAPVITEKTSGLQEYNRYSLYVDVRSNKRQIRYAINKVLNVNVLKISVMNVMGKKKRFKGKIGNRVNRKKVYFSVSPGSNLDMLKVQ